MSEARCETGWGGSLSSRTVPELRDHPTPLACASDPPPPGEGKMKVAPTFDKANDQAVPA